MVHRATAVFIASVSGALTVFAQEPPVVPPTSNMPPPPFCGQCPFIAGLTYAECAFSNGFNSSNLNLDVAQMCNLQSQVAAHTCHRDCTENLLPPAACGTLRANIPNFSTLSETICVDNSGRPDLVADVVSCNPFQITVTNKGGQAATRSTTRVEILATAPIVRNIDTPPLGPGGEVNLGAGMLPSFCINGCQVIVTANALNNVTNEFTRNNTTTQPCSTR